MFIFLILQRKSQQIKQINQKCCMVRFNLFHKIRSCEYRFIKKQKYNRQKMMNVNYKLKTRPTQQLTHRRTKTQTNENTNTTKKISFYLNKPLAKQPLQQNKKVLNQTETIQQQQQTTAYSQIKRQKPIKSIQTKNTTTKVNTQAYDKHGMIPLGQRQAIERIFQTGKITTNVPNRASDLGVKKAVIRQNFRQTFGLKDQRLPPQRDMHIPLRDTHLPTRQITYSMRQVRPQHLHQQQQLQGPQRYSFQDKVGAGTFGIVHKARDKKTLQIVAIKRVYQDKKYKNRELEILKTLNHPNTLKMKDCFYTYQGDKQYLNVVMDYFDLNLYQSIQKYRTKNTQMPRLKLKVFAFQLFRSLVYLNKISIAHRDIKPQNILVNDSNLKLVMCDFGSAKQLRPGEPNIAYICSRCYRAPELIFGNTNYTTQIDMWSAGCVLVEMITMEPIFRAESNIDQLVQIIKILGTPTYSEMLEMNPECDFQKYKLPKIGAKNWQKIIRRKNLGDQFIDLVKKVLQYSPQKRITPLEALSHPFFDELRHEQTYLKLKKQFNMPKLFDFYSTKQVQFEKIKLLIPPWYKEV